MMTMMRLLVLAAFVTLVGCRKDPANNLTEEEQRIYITNYDKAASFNSFRTYSIADRVVVVDGNSSTQQNTSADRALMDALDAALQSRGFQKAASTTAADVGIQISRIVRTSTGFVTGPDYYGYWDPFYWGYGSGWGSGFGGWGSGWAVMPYEVREGMLAIDMIDLKNSSPRVLWNALVRGPGLSSPSSMTDIVNNLLQQSPYLKAN
jgi:hypothetical protein